jgi:glycosyltransferase involved in cell wall biosynthesis
MAKEKISAIVHTSNDARRIGRALESLRVCDEVVVIDHGSQDDSVKVAREHGATVREGVPGVQPGAYVIDLRHDWVFCLLPSEALSEPLEAELHEWKGEDHDSDVAFCMPVREESNGGWRDLPAEARLVNRKRLNWTDKLPPNNTPGKALPGEILRFENP